MPSAARRSIPQRNGEITNESATWTLGITLTDGDPETSFNLSGYVNRYPDYQFNAKVHDRGSAFGIDGRRISKLDVRRGGELVIQYDRGWSIEPRASRERKVLKAIVASFPERAPDQEGAERGAAGRWPLCSCRALARRPRRRDPERDR